MDEIGASANNIGGLVGYNSATIGNSYATGAVNGNVDVGGFVGYNHGGAVTDAFAVGAVSGSDSNIGGR